MYKPYLYATPDKLGYESQKWFLIFAHIYI